MHAVVHPADRVRTVATVIHEDPLLRMGISATLRSDPRFDVRAWPDVPPAEAAPSLGMSGIDVVVTDYDAGLALASRRGSDRFRPSVLIVTQRDSASEVRAALAGGVLGYLLMGCRLEEVVDGVLAVQRGQRYLDRAAAGRMAEELVHQALTARESEVLRFVVAGWSNKMIANHLDLALGTVKCHVKAILDKLGATSRTHAAMVAQRRGLLAADATENLVYAGSGTAMLRPMDSGKAYQQAWP